MSLGTLWVEINARMDEAAKVLQQFGQQTDSFVSEQKSKWEGLANVGQSFMQLGGALTAGLTVPIAGMGAAAVAAASDFESSLNKITAVSGTTGGDLEKLRAQAMQLGADTKFSAQEAAEGMGNLAAAGQNTTQIMATMPGVLSLAAAGELSVARAAEVTTDTLNQFGLKAGEAGHVADIFAKGAAASSISVEQMAQSMKYAGPIAQTAGMSLEQTATAVALLGNAGIKGEQAGTSLRGMIGSLVDPSTKAAEALNALGVKTTDAAGKMLPLDQIFQQLKTSGATTADMFTIFGNEGASAASVLTGVVGPAWASMTQEMNNTQGAAKTMSDTLNTGLKGGFEQLKGSVDTALISLGQALLPAITTLVTAGTGFINTVIIPLIDGFKNLPAPVQAGIATFVGLAAALGPVLVAIGAIVAAIGTLMPALGTVAAFFGTSVALLAPWALAIGAVLAALVALGTWVYQNWDGIVASLNGAWTGIKEAWETTWNGITTAITTIWDTFKNTVAPYWKFVTDLVGAIWNVITALWEAEWKLITGALKAAWGFIEPAVDAVLGPVVTALEKIWDGIEKVWESAWKTIKSAVTAVWELFEKAVDTVYGPVVRDLGKVWDGLERIWKNTWEGIERTLTGIWTRMTAAVTTAWNAITSIGNKITGLPGKLNDLAGSIRSVGQEADKAAGHSPVPELVAALTGLNETSQKSPGLLDPVADSIAGIGTDAAAAKTNLGTFGTGVGEITTSLTTALAPALTGARTAIAGVGTDASTASPFVDGLKTSIGNLATNAVTWFGQIVTNAGLAYGAVKGTPGPATKENNQLVGMIDAQVAAAKQASTDIPAEVGTQLSGIKTRLENPSTGVPSFKAPWEQFSADVKGIIGNAVSGMAQSLFEGDGSFGEKAKGMLTSLGTAVMNSFVTPATTAITEFLNGVLKDLLGGRGFGGLKQSIEDAGAAFKRIFGKGGEVEEAGPAGGGPPGGGGAGGGAGAAMGGLTGWITAISGVVTAISSIIQNFQLAKMETTLNAIEHNTRYSMMYLGERSDGGIIGRLYDISDKMQWVPGLLDGINAKLLDWLSPLHDDLVAIGETLAAAKVRLDEISHSAMWGSAADGAGNQTLAEIRNMMMAERMEPPKFATVTFQGDPIASQVGNEIMRQLRLQGVNLV